MTYKAEAQAFIDRCREWLCDGYFADIRYFAVPSADGPTLFEAKILLTPLPPGDDNRLKLEVPDLVFGQEQFSNVAKDELLDLLTKALSGRLEVHGRTLLLPAEGGMYRWQRGFPSQAPWSMPLSAQLIGARAGYLDRSRIDDGLRAATPPFDGTEDLTSWLGLKLPDGSTSATLSVEVAPPVDLWADDHGLSDGLLTLKLHAHPNVQRDKIGVAIRPLPGGLASRIQIADKIDWSAPTAGGFIEGTSQIPLPKANGAMVMVRYGSDTVRRNGYLDLSKASNHRFVAVQQFDPDLKMIRHGLFESQDQAKFEHAVAVVLFLLGFSPAVQLETNSPDIIVATPRGSLVLVECTTRTSDIAAKVGKLVDRRAALARSLASDTQPFEVTAALVCRSARDQIAVHNDYLRSHQILLASSETLNDALVRARVPSDSDALLALSKRSLLE